jgi:hypothetical protein
VRIIYRVRQFWLALTAVPSAEDLDLARKYLSPSLMTLFLRMDKSEQTHSCAILRQLLERGENQGDLLVAALLHDVGKSRHPLRLWERIVIVLGNAFAPNQVCNWAQGEPRGWKRPFVVANQHAKWGADLAQLAGASPLSVTIIKRHQEPMKVQYEEESTQSELYLLEDQLLHKLIQLDNES